MKKKIGLIIVAVWSQSWLIVGVVERAGAGAAASLPPQQDQQQQGNCRACESRCRLAG